MVSLLLCILFSASLIFIFKLFDKWQVPVAQAIFFNYLTCMGLAALVFPEGYTVLAQQGLQASWLWTAMLAGCLFFVSFYLIAESARAAGVAITAVAQKVSLVIPAAATLLFWSAADETLSPLSLTGLLLAVAAVVLASWRKKNGKTKHVAEAQAGLKPEGRLARLLPLVVFINAGMADTLINYANYRYLKPELQTAFTTAVFATAALLGLLAQLYQLLLKHKKLQWRSMAGGLLLGVPNLLSLLFLLRALSAFDNNGAFVYPIVNMGVIMLSTAGGLWFFRERLRRLNWLGLGLAVVALSLLLVSELR